MDKIVLVSEEMLESSLYESLREHRMPDFFLYIGDEGAKSWLRLDNSKEFPISRHLTALLRESLPALLPFLPPNGQVVSVGAGNGEKERILLEELARIGSPSYVPVDVSSRMVDVALESVRHLDIPKQGVVGLFEDLSLMREYWRSPLLLCVLGNTACNFEPEFFFETLSRNLSDDDLLLLDFHLLPDCGGTGDTRRKIERTYRSRRNAFFNLEPLLRRGIHPDDMEFRLDLLPVSTSVGIVYRTFKSVHIHRQCGVSCGKNAVFFREGDIIRLGFTYKYTPDQIEPLIKRNGFTIVSLHRTPDGENQLVLARKSAVREE